MERCLLNLFHFFCVCWSSSLGWTTLICFYCYLHRLLSLEKWVLVEIFVRLVFSTVRQSTEGIPASTLHHITTTISNMIELIERRNAMPFRFSSLGSLVVENFFSIPRAKNPVFCWRVCKIPRTHTQSCKSSLETLICASRYQGPNLEKLL